MRVGKQKPTLFQRTQTLYCYAHQIRLPQSIAEMRQQNHDWFSAISNVCFSLQDRSPLEKGRALAEDRFTSRTRRE